MEVSRAGSEGLSVALELSCYGTVVSLHLFSAPDGGTRLLLLTRDLRLFVLHADHDTTDLRTSAVGNLLDASADPMDVPPVVLVDPNARLLAVFAADGVCKVN